MNSKRPSLKTNNKNQTRTATKERKERKGKAEVIKQLRRSYCIHCGRKLDLVGVECTKYSRVQNVGSGTPYGRETPRCSKAGEEVCAKTSKTIDPHLESYNL